MELALATALKAYELNPDDYETHWTLGFVNLYLRDFDLATAGYEHALELNSNDADFLAQMAAVSLIQVFDKLPSATYLFIGYKIIS